MYLCQKIYKQHRQALDLIYEHRPDLQSDVADFLEALIDQVDANLAKDDSNKRWIRFAPLGWDELTFQRTCQRWTSSQRLLLFEFVNEPQYLGLHLVIGPGDNSYKERIYQAIKTADIAGITKSQLKAAGWSRILKQTVLKATDYEDGDFESIKEKIDAFWRKYLQNDAPKIGEVIVQAFVGE